MRQLKLWETPKRSVKALLPEIYSKGFTKKIDSSCRSPWWVGFFFLRHNTEKYFLLPQTLFSERFSIHLSVRIYSASARPLRSVFTSIIKVMLLLPFSPSLLLSFSTDNKFCSPSLCAASHYRRHVPLCAPITACSHRIRPRVSIHIHIKCLIREQVPDWLGSRHMSHQSDVV